MSDVLFFVFSFSMWRSQKYAFVLLFTMYSPFFYGFPGMLCFHMPLAFFIPWYVPLLLSIHSFHWSIINCAVGYFSIHKTSFVCLFYVLDLICVVGGFRCVVGFVFIWLFVFAGLMHIVIMIIDVEMISQTYDEDSYFAFPLQNFGH